MKKLLIKLIIVLLMTISLTSCYTIVEIDKLYEIAEIAYFEGQKGALNNDIRIKLNQDSCWVWTKSPWNNNKPPQFNPSFNCEK